MRTFGARAVLGSGALHRSPVAALLIVLRSAVHCWLPARRLQTTGGYARVACFGCAASAAPNTAWAHGRRGAG
eukprot:3223122-Alexandrium_andersonii.AAC.1